MNRLGRIKSGPVRHSDGFYLKKPSGAAGTGFCLRLYRRTLVFELSHHLQLLLNFKPTAHTVGHIYCIDRRPPALLPAANCGVAD